MLEYTEKPEDWPLSQRAWEIWQETMEAIKSGQKIDRKPLKYWKNAVKKS